MGQENQESSENETKISGTKLSDAQQRLWTVVKDGAVKVMKDAPRVWKGPDQEEYRYEQAAIRLAYQPIMWGIGCAFVSFLSFRLGSSQWMKRYRATGRFTSSSSIKTPTAPRQQEQPGQFQGSLEKQREKQKEALSEALSIPTDLMLSLLIGGSVGVFLKDQEETKRNLEQIPLFPGKSLVSHHVCGPLMEAYQEVEPNVQRHPSLETYATMVRNCRKRNQYEAKLQQQSLLGLGGQQEQLSIPYPGVPKW